jgi:outer membrane protein
LLLIAETRAGFIRARFQAGAIPRIDTDEADAEVFRRQASFEKSERDLQKAELKISNYLWNTDIEPLGLPARAALPSFVALAEEPKADEVALARNRAKEIRPELNAIDVSRDIVKLDLALARNDRRPALDLVVGPGYDLGDDGIGNTYKAGLLYSIPFFQNQARGRIQQAEVKLRKLDFEQQQQLRQIEIEIDDAVSAIRQNYRRYRATLAELSANRRLEQGETDRFNLGIGTLFLINQRERQRAESETRLVDVRVELEQSLAAYLAATAQLNPQ